MLQLLRGGIYNDKTYTQHGTLRNKGKADLK